MRIKAALSQETPIDGGMHRDDRFLKRIFQRFLLPNMFSVLGATANTLVDSAIIGNLMGTQALAAMNLCGPVSLLCCAAGGLIGSGGGYLAAGFIGKNDERSSRQCYTAAVLLETLFGLIVAIVGCAFIQYVVKLLGADSALSEMTKSYARILLLSAPLKCLLYVPFHFLRLEGKPEAVSVSLLAMIAVNGVLDVLLIQMGFGMAGASAASALGTLAGVGIGFFYLHRSSFQFVSLRGAGRLTGRLLLLGSPAAVNNLLAMLRMVLLNRLLMRAGGSGWVAAFTLAGSLADFALCVLNGVSQTAVPLIGVYRAEKNNVALRRLTMLQLIYGEALICVFALVVALFPGLFCGLFGLHASVQAELAARMFALALPFSMLCTVLFFFYSAMERVGLANWIVFCRVFLFAVPPAFLLLHTGAAVWLFYPLSEVLTLLALLPALKRERRRNPALTPALLLDDRMEREGKVIDFSVENRPSAVTEAAEKISAFCEANSLTPKELMAVSLSIEEMLLIILEHCFQQGESATADVRVYVLPDEIGIRIRNAGKTFNPLEYYKEQRDKDAFGETLGLRMIEAMAKKVIYQRTFGVNTLTISL
ncbi:hypothetical protein D7X33_03110 [Butyricicoccus sp. 1XD8-22]|nr:hypothetical protein D7X33_03110 [Butyricicoccus sp. 1XD8-22]